MKYSTVPVSLTKKKTPRSRSYSFEEVAQLSQMLDEVRSGMNALKVELSEEDNYVSYRTKIRRFAATKYDMPHLMFKKQRDGSFLVWVPTEEQWERSRRHSKVVPADVLPV